MPASAKVWQTELKWPGLFSKNNDNCLIFMLIASSVNSPQL